MISQLIFSSSVRPKTHILPTPHLRPDGKIRKKYWMFFDRRMKRIKMYEVSE
jgi:hypothetical protein